MEVVSRWTNKYVYWNTALNDFDNVKSQILKKRTVFIQKQPQIDCYFLMLPETVAFWGQCWKARTSRTGILCRNTKGKHRKHRYFPRKKKTLRFRCHDNVKFKKMKLRTLAHISPQWLCLAAISGSVGLNVTIHPNVSYGCESFAVLDADAATLKESDRKNTKLSAGKLVKLSAEGIPSFAHKYVFNPVVCCLKSNVNLKGLFLWSL
jgi:hypothetical protein